MLYLLFWTHTFGIWSYWYLLLLVSGLIGIRSYWYPILLVFDLIGTWSYWYLVLLVFGLIGILSYWYFFLLEGFSKEKHTFHGVGSSPGEIFEKMTTCKTKNITFCLIACYPILIPDSEST